MHLPHKRWGVPLIFYPEYHQSVLLQYFNIVLKQHCNILFRYRMIIPCWRLDSCNTICPWNTTPMLKTTYTPLATSFHMYIKPDFSFVFAGTLQSTIFLLASLQSPYKSIMCLQGGTFKVCHFFNVGNGQVTLEDILFSGYHPCCHGLKPRKVVYLQIRKVFW